MGSTTGTVKHSYGGRAIDLYCKCALTHPGLVREYPYRYSEAFLWGGGGGGGGGRAIDVIINYVYNYYKCALTIASDYTY